MKEQKVVEESADRASRAGGKAMHQINQETEQRKIREEEDARGAAERARKDAELATERARKDAIRTENQTGL